MQQKQQELDQQRYQTDAQIQQAERQHQEEMANANYQKQLDRISKQEVATIMAQAREKAPLDVNQDFIPDALEVNKLQHEQDKASKDYQLKMMDIQNRNSTAMEKLKIEREKMDTERQNHKDDIEIAKINARNRGNKKSK